MNIPLDRNEWMGLLGALERLSPASDWVEDEVVLGGFLPLREHASALAPQTLMIRGERGTGKTTLFRVLSLAKHRNLPLREIFSGYTPFDALWCEGFGERGTDHPPVETLTEFSRRHVDDRELRLFWLGHLAGKLGVESGIPSLAGGTPLQSWASHRGRPSSWIADARTHMDEMFQWLDRLDHWAIQQDRWVIATYDNLDRIPSDSTGARERYIQALLSLWMSLASRYERIRCKVFLREDLFRHLRDIPDASKLDARSVSLAWSTEHLFRLLIRQMAGQSDLLEWFQDGGIPLAPNATLGWMPPESLPEDGRVSRRSLIARIAPEIMGSGVKKGMTHRWIPNHLQDANGAIAPRSIINLFSLAARDALSRGNPPAAGHLMPTLSFANALAETSRRRMKELREEHPVVDCLQAFHGQTAPFSIADFLATLAQMPDFTDSAGLDGRSVFDELLRLGIISLRTDKRVDIPDIYRFGLGIKRKGGVKQPS